MPAVAAPSSASAPRRRSQQPASLTASGTPPLSPAATRLYSRLVAQAEQRRYSYDQAVERAARRYLR